MTTQSTSARILSIARELLASEGVSGVSFDAIARKLGRSKQAVLYWFPTKQDLIAAMFVPWLEAEMQTAIAALQDTHNREDAISAFVRALADFHRRDLDRFRMMYLVPQTLRSGSAATGPGSSLEDGMAHGAVLGKIHPVTDRMYGALADCISPEAPAGARKEAMAVHSAVLGLILMLALADAVQDPIKHSPDEMIGTLAAMLSGKRATAPAGRGGG
jgi:AcrR family transcriptional regulator